MAGGIGSRFWPLSTPEYPKQFIDILGCGRTLIQLTTDRFKGICPDENFWVVTNAAYVDIVKQQLPGIPAAHILAEPAARNTAPCIAWACWRIRQECADANVVVTPADAVGMNPDEFRRIISNALDFTARRNSIVTIGIKPNRPETGYGYVEARADQDAQEGPIVAVSQFKEKPCLEVAQQYLAAGNYLWNAGIFVWNVSTIVESIRTYKPNIADDMDRIAATGDVEHIFPQCEKISIDYAVMEPAAAEGKVFTHPADFGWSDIGTWGSFYTHAQHDLSGNALLGNIVINECQNSVVNVEEGTEAIVQGLDNCLVAYRDHSLLVCRLQDEQRIKNWVEELDKRK